MTFHKLWAHCISQGYHHDTNRNSDFKSTRSRTDTHGGLSLRPLWQRSWFAIMPLTKSMKKNHISSSVSCYQNTINNRCFDTAQCSSQGFIVIKHVAFTKWFNFWSDKTSSVTYKRKYPLSSIVYVEFPLSPSPSSTVKTFLSVKYRDCCQQQVKVVISLYSPPQGDTFPLSGRNI